MKNWSFGINSIRINNQWNRVKRQVNYFGNSYSNNYIQLLFGIVEEFGLQLATNGEHNDKMMQSLQQCTYYMINNNRALKIESTMTFERCRLFLDTLVFAPK